MGRYSIKDLEQLSGIKAHTIRIWEQRYNIIVPSRTSTNIRYYDDEALKLLLNIALLNDHGFKISKIAGMPYDQIVREVMNITEAGTQHDDQIHGLTLAMIDLDTERFERIIASNTLRHGFEQTMLKIIFPFLSKIGVLWQTGAINPAHEHFISNLIRQKLITAIDGQHTVPHESQKKFLLFLPEGELHEISLLFSDYIIKSRGAQSIYLGQSLPFGDLKSIVDWYQPEYLLSVITTFPGPSEIQKYVDRLSQAFPHSKILLTGYQVVGQELHFPSNVTIIQRVEHLIEMLESVGVGQNV